MKAYGNFRIYRVLIWLLVTFFTSIAFAKIAIATGAPHSSLSLFSILFIRYAFIMLLIQALISANDYLQLQRLAEKWEVDTNCAAYGLYDLRLYKIPGYQNWDREQFFYFLWEAERIKYGKPITEIQTGG